ncbi:hypothetical protein IPA_05260 [Ignicoccus pacificus DSM 13166]|uniref:HEPN domain-containing protein n=1 Tax=Ignicoccus pacificus DSM 13166 TaxID=940294 RepID=A0A977KCS5_9CREN|nr:hypothetical protein IPA_05260 [Ignicoccus pacificus DSM 13166]
MYELSWRRKRELSEYMLNLAKKELEEGMYEMAALHASLALETYLRSMIERLRGRSIKRKGLSDLWFELTFTLTLWEGFRGYSGLFEDLYTNNSQLFEFMEEILESTIGEIDVGKKNSKEIIKLVEKVFDRLDVVVSEVWPS